MTIMDWFVVVLIAVIGVFAWYEIQSAWRQWVEVNADVTTDGRLKDRLILLVLPDKIEDLDAELWIDNAEEIIDVADTRGAELGLWDVGDLFSSVKDLSVVLRAKPWRDRSGQEVTGWGYTGSIIDIVYTKHPGDGAFLRECIKHWAEVNNLPVDRYQTFGGDWWKPEHSQLIQEMRGEIYARD